MLTILSDGVDIEMASISHNAPGSDTITLPSARATITSANGILVGWQGPGSDGITCLPLSTITVTLIYICNQAADELSFSFNLTEELAVVIP